LPTNASVGALTENNPNDDENQNRAEAAAAQFFGSIASY
jgi:hypothetical protein